MKIADYSIFNESKSDLDESEKRFIKLVNEGVDKGFNLFLYDGDLYFIGKTDRYYVHELLNVDFEI